MRHSPLLRDVLQQLEDAGATKIEWWHGGKHYRVSATYRGQRVSATLPVSTCNWHAGRRQACDIKRKLRAIDSSITPQPIVYEEALT